MKNITENIDKILANSSNGEGGIQSNGIHKDIDWILFWNLYDPIETKLKDMIYFPIHRGVKNCLRHE